MRDADFRLVCSTNREPFEAISEGALREDLYYRINTIEIRIPPLRERMEDVPILAEYFLRQYAEKYERANAGFSQRCYDRMLQYHWRGNVRELQNTIERAVLLSRDGVIDKLDLPAGGNGSFDEAESHVVAHEYSSNDHGVDLSGLDDSAIFETTGKMIVDRLPEVNNETERKDVFDQVEKSIAIAALRRTGGNKQAAANLLGIYRPRLYGILKRHEITDTE